jgi:23S rRNA pseudouridine2605 synthase
MGSEREGRKPAYGSKSAEENTVRLQVYLARCGVGSRRGCETYIREGRVTVNGETVRERGHKVRPGDTVTFDGKELRPEQTMRYIALNKPPKYLCSNYDPEGRPLAVDLLSPHFEERLYNVGRLDFMSEGLILFTNDGNFALKAGHPSSNIEKEYLVEPAESLDAARRDELRRFLDTAKSGIRIEGESYTIRSFGIDDDGRVSVTLTEGKNREIRRLFAHFGISLKRLIRVRIGTVRLDDLPRGRYRHLSNEELQWFLDR